MNKGQGAIIRTNKVEPATPATVTTMQNGLSLVGTAGELGGTLLHNTDIDLAGFVYTLSDGLNDLLSIDPVSGQISIGDLNNFLGGVAIDMNQPGTILFKEGGLAGVNFLDFNDTAKLYQYGDLSGAGNQSVLLVDDNQQQLLFSTTSGNFLSIDVNNGLYQLGDISGSGNGSFFQVDDINQIVSSNPNKAALVYIDTANNNSFLGDANGIGNSTYVQADDNNSIVQISAANGLTLVGSATLLKTLTTLTNNAGAAAGTLLNAPAAGNPTKWIPINDNGTIRNIPAW